jgi:hypothetical protein
MARLRSLPELCQTDQFLRWQLNYQRARHSSGSSLGFGILAVAGMLGDRFPESEKFN